MKKEYVPPSIRANEFAQFENVYTGGCTKHYKGHRGWSDGCYYNAETHPSTSPSGTNRHKEVFGS